MYVCIYMYVCMYVCTSLPMGNDHHQLPCQRGSVGLHRICRQDQRTLIVTAHRGRKEIFYLTMHSKHFLFTIIWRRTYGKGPFR